MERIYHPSPKAWFASFPPNLWPAEEEETDDGRILLRLKDGTKLLAYEPTWTKELGLQVELSITLFTPAQVPAGLAALVVTIRIHNSARNFINAGLSRHLLFLR